MFNTGVDKNRSSKQNWQINPYENAKSGTQSAFIDNIFEDNASKYAIKVIEKDPRGGFPASRDPLGGLNLTGKPQPDLAPAQIKKDGGLKVTTYPEGGLNLTGEPKMVHPTLKAQDKGTRLLTNPDGGLNLTGKPVSQQLTIPNASGIVDFPDDDPVSDNETATVVLPKSDKQVEYPGNSDLTDDILSGKALPNKKYIITFPDDEPVAPKALTPQNPTPQISAPKTVAPQTAPTQTIAPKSIAPKTEPVIAPTTVAPKAAPKVTPPTQKTPAKVQTAIPAPMTAVPQVAPRDNRPIPDASAEIKSLYGQKMNVKNQRLYKLILENEYNPQLKEYLLTCRVDDLVQKVNAMNPEYITHLSKCCEKYGITKEEDKLTLLAQMQQESNLNPNAESRSHAFGFMQVMPGTAALMNKAYYKSSDRLISWNRKMDYRNPLDNIEMGVALMAENQRRYRNTETPMLTALGAYNAGTVPTDAYLYGTTVKTKKGTINPEGAKTLYGIPPYDEPQLYYQIIPATKDYMLRHPEKIATIRQLLASNQG